MARLSVFSYIPGSSFFHRVDPRIKLFCLACITTKAFTGDLGQNLILFVLLLASMLVSRIPVPVFFREIRWFFIMVFLVFLARSLTTPGREWFSVLGFSFTEEGMVQGGTIGLRLICALILGMLVTRTTCSPDLRAAISWYLQYLPFVPKNRVATALALFVRFIPLVLEEAQKTGEVVCARGITNRKNPVYRLSGFTLCFLQKCFRDANRFVTAMEARGYTGESGMAIMHHMGRPGRTDMLFLFFVLFFLVILIEI